MSAGKRVIIVAYYFPPLGLAGTHRPLAMANFFAERGHDVTVITVKDIAYPVHDPSLSDQIDSRVKVVRVGSRDLARAARAIGLGSVALTLRRSSYLKRKQTFFPDSKVGFAGPAYSAVRRLVKDGAETILLTTSPPVSAHGIGLKAREYLSVKWVSDWRDIWGPVFDSQDDRERISAYTREIVASADLVTATSPLTISEFEALQPGRNLLFLPNGYDETDFLQERPPVRVSVGLYGTINKLVDHQLLLSWLREFRQSNPRLLFKVRHTGYVDIPNFKSQLDRYDLEQCFRLDGYKPHREAVQQIRSSKVNLICLSDKYDTSYIVPSRLFELLRAEPPLIAVLPRVNAARQLLSERQFAGVSIVDRYEDFSVALQEYLTEPEERQGIRGESAAVFERQNQLDTLFGRVQIL